jgi:hypothetical protein
LGTVPVWLEADAPRVNCREHGPTVRAVPWARHAAGHTRAFDAQVAWLATQCSKTAVTELMRIAWRTVGAVIARVWDDVDAAHDRFAGLTRIGIDEISYKRGHHGCQQPRVAVGDEEVGLLGILRPALDELVDAMSGGRGRINDQRLFTRAAQCVPKSRVRHRWEQRAGKDDHRRCHGCNDTNPSSEPEALSSTPILDPGVSKRESYRH